MSILISLACMEKIEICIDSFRSIHCMFQKAIHYDFLAHRFMQALAAQRSTHDATIIQLKAHVTNLETKLHEKAPPVADPGVDQKLQDAMNKIDSLTKMCAERESELERMRQIENETEKKREKPKKTRPEKAPVSDYESDEDSESEEEDDESKHMTTQDGKVVSRLRPIGHCFHHKSFIYV